MRLPLWLKIVWTVWLAAWMPLYWKQYGLQNFLFFCDIGNLLIGLALWLESPLIFSWQACGLLLFQTLYVVDLAGALLTGRHAFGGTEYMFDSGIPLPVRLVSLFHVVTPPLLLWAIRRLGYDRRGWKLQTLTAWIVVPINYFWRPELDVAGHAVFIRAAIDLWRCGEIPVRRRRRRLPFERGGLPRIVTVHFVAVLDAPEQIDDERNLRQSQRHRAPQNPRVHFHDRVRQRIQMSGPAIGTPLASVMVPGIVRLAVDDVFKSGV